MNSAKHLNQYLFACIIAAVLCVAGIVVAEAFMEFYLPLWLSLGCASYYTISYVFTHKQLLKKAKERPAAFVTSFMGISALKLFLNLLILVILAFTNRQEAVALVIFYLILHMVFSFLDVWFLLKYLNKKQ